MSTREELNTLYRPLHEDGRAALQIIRGLGYGARLTYCNLHEVAVDGGYQTEYFPLPEIEIEIESLTLGADFGISLDRSAWLEIIVSRQAALALDYPALADRFTMEVYGVQEYLTDFYKAGMDANETAAHIAQSQEQEVHLCFRLASVEEQGIKNLFQYLKEAILP